MDYIIKMSSFSYIFVATISLLLSVSSDDPQYCQLDKEETPKVQIAFVIDGKLMNKIDVIQTTFIQFLTESLQNIIPSIEFAITAYWDWSVEVKETEKASSDTCYQLIHPFTSDKAEIFEGVKKVKKLFFNEFKEGQTSSSTMGILSTILEEELLWNEGFLSLDGKLVRKYVLFITAHRITNLKNDGSRRPIKLDGSDSCSNSLPPTETILRNVILDNNIELIGLILNMDGTTGNFTETEYYELLYKHEELPYMHYYIPDFGTLNVISAVGHDYKQESERILSYIQSNIVKCEWMNPPSYNTLAY